MTLRKWKYLLLAILLLATTLLPAVALAAEGDVITIKLPSISVEYTKVAGQEIMNFNWAAMLAFKNYVESNSGGRMKVELYSNASLGTGPEILQQCMQGVIEATTTGEADLSSYYPELQVFSIPFTFSNRAEFYALQDSDWMQAMYDDIAQKTNIRIIMSFDNGGFRNISNSIREIKAAEDLKGLKIRCMEVPAHLHMFNTLGALPTPMAYSELYTALQTGTVDGQENSPMVMMDGSMFEVQKYYTLDGHLISPAFIAVNETWLKSLDEDLQKVILDAGDIGEMAARGAINSGESVALNAMRGYGLQIYSPTAEEKATFAVAKEPVIEWLKGEISPEVVDSFLAAVDNVKAGKTTAASTAAQTQAGQAAEPAAPAATAAAGPATAAAASQQGGAAPSGGSMGYILVIVLLAAAVAVLIALLMKKKKA